MKTMFNRWHLRADIDWRAFGIAAHYGESEIAVLVLCFLFVWER